MLSDRGRSLVAWVVVMTSLVTLSMMFRLWAARVQKRSARLDDYLVTIAYVSLLALIGAGSWGIANGMGDHAATLTPGEMIVLLKVILSSGFTWTLSTTFCKLAVLAFYRIVFTTKKQRLAIDILFGLTAIYVVVFIPVMFTQCSPPSVAWSLNPELMAQACRPLNHQEYASVSVNIFLDTAVVLLPLPLIWGLKMKTSKKIGVTMMFGLGIIIVIILILRVQATVESSSDPDWTYGMYRTGLYSLLECQIGILAANMPTLAPLSSKLGIHQIKSYVSSKISSSKSRSGAGHGHVRLGTFGSGGKRRAAESDPDLLETYSGDNDGKSGTYFETRVERGDGGWPIGADRSEGIHRQIEMSVEHAEGTRAII